MKALGLVVLEKKIRVMRNVHVVYHNKAITLQCHYDPMIELFCKAPYTHSRFLATVPLRFATICKIVVYRGVPWSFVVEPW